MSLTMTVNFSDISLTWESQQKLKPIVKSYLSGFVGILLESSGVVPSARSFPREFSPYTNCWFQKCSSVC